MAKKTSLGRRPARWPARQLEVLEPRLMLDGADGAGFTKDLLVAGLNTPLAFDYVTSDRVFVAEKAGKVKVVEHGQVVGTFIDIGSEVEISGDRGLIGLAVDPASGDVFLNYTVKLTDPQCRPPSGLSFQPTACGQLIRVSPDVANPNVADVSTRVTVLDGHIMSDGTHSVGDVDFDADGNVIFTWGDGGFNPGLRLEAQNENSVQGKLFRVRPSVLDPNVYVGVSGNPFYDEANPSSVQSMVWALGLRNSWRMTVDHVTRDVYMGEVTDSGPEEINVLRGDGSTILNFGWPYFTHNIPNPPSFGTPPPGFQYEPAYVAYVHTNQGGGDAITGGAVYRGNDYPAVYDGRYFFGNIVQGTLYTADQQGNYQQFGVPGEYYLPADIQVGPDGLIHVLSMGGELWRLQHTGGVNNFPPVAVATATLTAGVGPLSVTFDASRSSDPNGDPLRYEWDFNSDGSTDSRLASPTYVFSRSGRHLVKLNVWDDQGGIGTATLEIDVLPAAPGDGNVALGKPAVQSSMYIPGIASRAVDGNTNGDFPGGHSTSHTLRERNPFWEVDLQWPHGIDVIELYNRTDCCLDRLRDIWVFVSLEPFNTGNLNALRADPTIWKFHEPGIAGASVAIPVGQPGRYVRVQLGGEDDILSLAEVKVRGTPPNLPAVTLVAGDSSAAETGRDPGQFVVSRDHTDGELTVFYDVQGTAAAADYDEELSGSIRFLDGIDAVTIDVTPVDDAEIESDETVVLTLQPHSGYFIGGQSSGVVDIMDNDAVNLALGKPAIQSSTDWTGAVAARAVDGNTNGDFSQGSVTHTQRDAMAFWEADLETVGNIGWIELHNRTDCCPQRLSDYWILVSDIPFLSDDLDVARTAPGVWSHHDPGIAGRTETLHVGRTGRHVRVQLAGVDFLSLAEVRVIEGGGNGTVDGDFNDDGLYNCSDIDALVAEIAGGLHPASFDLTGDGQVNLDDRDAWLAEAGALHLGPSRAYPLGDASLDGVVDGQDFGLWNANKFTSVAAWCSGDLNADGNVDGRDFNLWNAHKFMSPARGIPEPARQPVAEHGAAPAAAAAAGLFLPASQRSETAWGAANRFNRAFRIPPREPSHGCTDDPSEWSWILERRYRRSLFS